MASPPDRGETNTLGGIKDARVARQSEGKYEGFLLTDCTQTEKTKRERLDRNSNSGQAVLAY